MKVQRNFTWAVLAAAMFTAPAAFADSSSTVVVPTTTVPATSTASAASPAVSITKNMRAFYEMWLRGMNTQALSGNVSGGGTSLAITHTFGVGYRLGSKWAIGLTQGFTQTIDEKPASEKDPWVANDPYLMVSNTSLYKNEKYGFNLFGYVRYYLPFSRASSQNVAKAARTDAGLGSVRLYLNPTKTWLDGKLTLNLVTLLQYRLASRSDADRAAANKGSSAREDWYFLFDPILAYTLNSWAEVYLEYATGYLRHSTDGHFTKLNDASDGQYVSLGSNLLVGKKLLLNPYLSAGPVFRGVKNTDIGLIASYTFL
jgi:opacity protein-like surface antigen